MKSVTNLDSRNIAEMEKTKPVFEAMFADAKLLPNGDIVVPTADPPKISAFELFRYLADDSEGTDSVHPTKDTP